MQDTYIALDLETTGLSPYKDQILEIGALKVEAAFCRDPDGDHTGNDPERSGCFQSGSGIPGICGRFSSAGP